MAYVEMIFSGGRSSNASKGGVGPVAPLAAFGLQKGTPPKQKKTHKHILGFKKHHPQRKNNKKVKESVSFAPSGSKRARRWISPEDQREVLKRLIQVDSNQPSVAS